MQEKFMFIGTDPELTLLSFLNKEKISSKDEEEILKRFNSIHKENFEEICENITNILKENNEDIIKEYNNIEQRFLAEIAIIKAIKNKQQSNVNFLTSVEYFINYRHEKNEMTTIWMTLEHAIVEYFKDIDNEKDIMKKKKMEERFNLLVKISDYILENARELGFNPSIQDNKDNTFLHFLIKKLIKFNALKDEKGDLISPILSHLDELIYKYFYLIFDNKLLDELLYTKKNKANKTVIELFEGEDENLELKSWVEETAEICDNRNYIIMITEKIVGELKAAWLPWNREKKVNAINAILQYLKDDPANINSKQFSIVLSMLVQCCDIPRNRLYFFNPFNCCNESPANSGLEIRRVLRGTMPKLIFTKAEVYQFYNSEKSTEVLKDLVEKKFNTIVKNIGTQQGAPVSGTDNIAIQ